MKSLAWFSGAMAVAGIVASHELALAQASESHKAAAIALYDEAEKLMAAGDFAGACPKYAESNRLDPQLGALLHLADCYEKNGQLASAWASWRDAIEIAQRRGDTREKVARDHAAALEPKLSKLVIQVPAGNEVPGLEIRRDDAVVNRALWGTPMPVDAGVHTIEVSAPGKRTRKSKITVPGNAATQNYEIAALEDAGAAAIDAATGAPATDRVARDETGAKPGATQRTIGLITGGLGIVGLGAGLLFELQRSSKESDRDAICPSNKCTVDEAKRIEELNDEVSSAAKAETISFVAGGVLLAGGAILWLTAPSEKPQTSRRVLLGPMIANGRYGLSAIGSW